MKKFSIPKLDPLEIKFIIASPFYLIGTGVIIECKDFLHMNTAFSECMYALILTAICYTIGNTVYSIAHIIAKMIHKAPTIK